MNGSDLCRHCGCRRLEHNPPSGPQHLLECPYGMGHTMSGNFDNFATDQRVSPPEPITLPADPQPDASRERKACPLYAGCLAYFPDALLLVAKLSKLGNDKHNPGEPLHWSKDKSADHADCLARHLLEHGQTDPDTGLSHTVAVAWRALALLQTEIENARKDGAS